MIQKRGIALLITLLFIVAITLSVGIGLKQVKNASEYINTEKFILQTSVILDDVQQLLKNSAELKEVADDTSGESLFIFLSESGFIPFEAGDIKVSLEIKSARARLNINSIIDTNTSNEQGTSDRINALSTYLNNYNINVAYGDMILDIMGGIKEDMSYNSDIFYQKPYLFRDYIVSAKHLDEINDFYMKTYHENSLKNIELSDIFSFNKDRNTSMDLNYISAQTWELLLSTDNLRAEELSAGGGSYTNDESLNLSVEEMLALKRFKYSYYEPYLDVNIEVIQNNSIAKIHFEYDIKNKKGSNFSYEI